MQVTINKKTKVSPQNVTSFQHKKWGSIWVKYIDDRGIKKIGKIRGDYKGTISLINQHRIILGLTMIKVEDERENIC